MARGVSQVTSERGLFLFTERLTTLCCQLLLKYPAYLQGRSQEAPPSYSRKTVVPFGKESKQHLLCVLFFVLKVGRFFLSSV